MRKSPRSFLSRSTVIVLLAVAACAGPSPEQQVLTRFFEASRLYDKTMLASFGTIVFNPVTDGVVQEFTITSIGGQRTLDAGRISEEVTLAAIVRTADGRTLSRTLVTTLENTTGRWTIVGLR